MKAFFYTILLGLSVQITFGQHDTLPLPKDSILNLSPKWVTRAEDPLSPSRAAFYSAVLPGLGQVYNKSYWKLPLVYGGIGTGLYFYFDNKKAYHKYRDIYRRRQNGFRDDEFKNIDDDRIVRAMRQMQKNKDLSLAITFGIYILNILDANVDAHLQQFNVDDDLTFQPTFEFNETDQSYQFGVRMTYKF